MSQPKWRWFYETFSLHLVLQNISTENKDGFMKCPSALNFVVHFHWKDIPTVLSFAKLSSTGFMKHPQCIQFCRMSLPKRSWFNKMSPLHLGLQNIFTEKRMVLQDIPTTFQLCIMSPSKWRLFNKISPLHSVLQDFFTDKRIVSLEISNVFNFSECLH